MFLELWDVRSKCIFFMDEFSIGYGLKISDDRTGFVEFSSNRLSYTNEMFSREDMTIDCRHDYFYFSFLSFIIIYKELYDIDFMLSFSCWGA